VHLDNALGGQPAERFAYRRSRDPQLGRDVFLVDPPATPEVAVANALADRLIHLIDNACDL
jgi:hypothetical protein